MEQVKLQLPMSVGLQMAGISVTGTNERVVQARATPTFAMTACAVIAPSQIARRGGGARGPGHHTPTLTMLVARSALQR